MDSNAMLIYFDSLLCFVVSNVFIDYDVSSQMNWYSNFNDNVIEGPTEVELRPRDMRHVFTKCCKKLMSFRKAVGKQTKK